MHNDQSRRCQWLVNTKRRVTNLSSFFLLILPARKREAASLLLFAGENYSKRESLGNAFSEKKIGNDAQLMNEEGRDVPSPAK